MSRRLNIAMLSEDAELSIDALGADAAAATVDALDVADDSAEVTEVTELGGDIEQISGIIEEADGDAEAIEEAATVAEQANEEGGMPAVAAEALHHMVNHVLKKHGIRPQVFASESFSSKAARPRSTRIAVEGWKEKAKEIWDKIVKVVKAAIARVRDFFAALGNRAEKLRQQGEKLAAAAKTKGNAKADAGSIEIGAAAQYLYKDGTFVGGAGLAAAFEAHAAQIDTTLRSKVSEVTAGVATEARALFAVVNDKQLFDKNLGNVKWPTGAAANDKKVEGLPEGFAVTEVAKLLGERQVYAVSPSNPTTEQLAAGLLKIRVFVDTADGYKAPTETKGEQAAALDVAKIGQALAKHYGGYAERVKKLTEASKAVDDALRTPPKSDSEIGATNAKVAIKVIQVLGNLVTVTQSQIYGYDVSVGSAVYSYCAKSLKGQDDVKNEGKK